MADSFLAVQEAYLEDQMASLEDLEAYREGHSFQEEVEDQEAFPYLEVEAAFPFLEVEEEENHLLSLHQEAAEGVEQDHPFLEEVAEEEAFLTFLEAEEY